MKGLGAILLFLLVGQGAASQMDLAFFTGMLDQNPRKLESQLQKKGFTREHHFTDHEIRYVNIGADSIAINRNLQLNTQKENPEITYTTSCPTEFAMLEKELSAQSISFSKEASGIFYHPKQNLVFSFHKKKVDTTIYYSIMASRIQLPRAKDLVYAEDLLTIEAHLYLESIFGKENVKEERFYFSDSLSKKCSVIFPNSNRQAIFLWEDEQYMKDLLFVIIGEQISRNPKTINQVSLPVWRSKQGIACGMNIKEVEAINQAPVEFYRWRSPYAGTLARGNKGEIDFKNLELVLDCMNCNFLPASGNTEVISSATAHNLNQRWYVQSFAVLKPR